MLLPNRYRLRLPATVAIAVAIAAASCVLRVWAGIGDLWLDEVWSIQLADELTAPWQVVTRLRSDNNHMLNTAYVGWLGVDQSPLVYRLLSIVAGTLSVLVVGAIAAERGRVEQWTAMLLVATSFLMVHYSSEARGYAVALFLALSAYWSLLRFLKHGSDRHAICFACCASFGFLAHPTFIYFYMAACYWSVTVLPAASRHWSHAVRPVLMLHGLPSVVVVVLYLVNFRHLELGGGPDYDLASVLAQTGSLAIGGPALGIGAMIGALCFTAAVIGSLSVMWRDNDQQSTTLAFCVALPLIAAVVTQTPFLFVRYFLIAIVFAQLIFAFGLAWLYRQGRLGRLAFGALLALFVLANLIHVGNLYRLGRGNYLAALQFIADQDSNEIITIGSNHDHGTSILVDYYRHRMRSPREIQYCRVADWANDGEVPGSARHPNWLILHHDPAEGPANYQKTYVVAGQTYELSRMFDAAILSGWQWFCFRRVCPEPPTGKFSREMVNVLTTTDR